MEQCVLTIGTVTGAIRARKLLGAAGIAARLIKRTGKQSGGCAYGLEIRAADMQRAMHALKEGGISFEWSRGRVER